MNRHPMHRCALRFHRTASDAFKDHAYGAAIERPMPSLWRRMWIAFKEWL